MPLLRNLSETRALTTMSLSTLSWWDSLLDTLRLYCSSLLPSLRELAVVCRIPASSPARMYF